MEIREYRESDLEAIVRLFYDTVHNINIRDYSSAQIEVWTAGIDMERWNSTLSEHLSLVALDGSVVIGFGAVSYAHLTLPTNREVRCVVGGASV